MTSLPAGAYEHLVTTGLQRRLAAVDGLAQRQPLDAADSHEVLARHLGALARRALAAVPGPEAERIARQVALANDIAAAIGRHLPGVTLDEDLVAATHDLLTAVAARHDAPAAPSFPVRPETPLAVGALLVNGRRQPSIGAEIERELASADRVDLLCAFITWTGVRLITRPVRELIDRGGTLRIITTTYLGATNQRALDHLAGLGAQIRVSYETRTTRLHAKAWLFHRESGAHTAYVGSSNLSRAALVDGLEWNVRLSGLEQPSLVETFAASFEEYWCDPAFEEYRPERDGDRLRRALAAESGSHAQDLDLDLTTVEVRPYGYQQEILEDLAAEREVHGRLRNLVVMATGTGKTVVAALDYRRLLRAGHVRSLLFVAHQEQILRQSRSVFRHVVGDGSFGELLVGGERPEHWGHVFASIQSLHRLGPDRLDPARFDMVIVDEFHHAEAATYTTLLNHLRPRILLGLTATPERSDGQDVRRWFDGRTGAELRLWEALDRQLLAPFQYFGLHDDIDLSQVTWRRGQGYDKRELDRVYTGHDARARLILRSVRDIADIARMRALGFCVSVDHARFMADFFTRAGVPARAVTADSDRATRQRAIRDLRDGDLRVIFTVDLFNEGVDIPAVDTILLLRPTESATIFLQQLGRGLRLAEGKSCLTVLDFIGAQHARFRFDLRYRALTGTSRRALARAVEDEFPTLPAGCRIRLDRVAQRIVLDNLRASLRLRTRDLVAELRRLGDVDLATFLAETGLDLEDLYRRRALGGWTGLRRAAGLDTTGRGPDDDTLGAAIGRLLHLDDPARLDHLVRLARGGEEPGRPGDMLHVLLWAAAVDRADGPGRLADNPSRAAELVQVAGILRERIRRVTWPVDPAGRIPLHVHARYSRNEALAAFGVARPWQVREGVKWVEAERADLFFVTLTKTEAHYSPTTMYQDRAITPEIFQWESQSTTSTASPTGQRYLNHAARGSTVHLFLRETKVGDGDLGAPPYLYAGPMTYRSHTGDRPMRILWRLRHALPAEVFHAARVLSA